MKPLRLFVIAVLGLYIVTIVWACWVPELYGQAYTFPQLSTDLAAHQISLPIPCPNTITPANCTGPNNQSLTGANSIWAECDFATTAPISNTECPAHTTPATQLVASNATAAFNNNYVHLIRATDSATGSTAQNWYGTASGGQWGEEVWDSTATRLQVQDQNHQTIILSFQPDHTKPNYLTFTRLYGSTAWTIKGGFFSRQPASSFPSGQTVSLFYTVALSQNIPGMDLTAYPSGHVLILSFDFSSTTTAPTYVTGNTGKIHVIVDLSAVPGCLVGYSGPGLVNSFLPTFDDKYFKMNLWSSGASGNFDTVLLYDVVNNKCNKWQSDTGVVTLNNTTAGNIVEQISGQPFTTGSSGSGNQEFGYPYVSYLETATDITPCLPAAACFGAPRFSWETGIPYAGNSSPTGLRAWNVANIIGGGLGHYAGGFNHIAATGANSSAGWWPIYIADPIAQTNVLLNKNVIPFASVPSSGCFAYDSPTALSWCSGFDDHWTWNLSTSGNDDAPGVDIPYYETTACSPNSAVTCRVPPTGIPWMHELLIWPTVCRVNGTCTSNPIKPWRATHIFMDQNLAQVLPAQSPETVTSVVASSGGQTTYTGTFSNTYTKRVIIKGFSNAANNGEYTGVSSTSTTLVVKNPNAVAEGPVTATAASSTGQWDYSSSVAAGNVAPYPVDGHIFIAFASNWQGQLGCGNGTYDTYFSPPGIGCPPSFARTDVFVAAVPVVSPTSSGYFYPWHN